MRKTDQITQVRALPEDAQLELELEWESSRYPGKAVRAGDAWRTRRKQGPQASGDPGESGRDSMHEGSGQGV